MSFGTKLLKQEKLGQIAPDLTASSRAEETAGQRKYGRNLSVDE